MALSFCSSCSKPIERDNQNDYDALGVGDLCGECAKEILNGIGGGA